MVAGRGKAVFQKLIADLLHIFAGGAVNDAGAVGMCAQILPDAPVLILVVAHFEVEVLAVEARDGHMGGIEGEHADDVLLYLLCGGGGKRADHRTGGKRLDKLRDP